MKKAVEGPRKGQWKGQGKAVSYRNDGLTRGRQPGRVGRRAGLRAMAVNVIEGPLSPLFSPPFPSLLSPLSSLPVSPLSSPLYSLFPSLPSSLLSSPLSSLLPTRLSTFLSSLLSSRLSALLSHHFPSLLSPPRNLAKRRLLHPLLSDCNTAMSTELRRGGARRCGNGRVGCVC